MNNVSLLFAFILLLASTSEKTKIYEWRGANREGIYNESNLLKTWPAEGPKELWVINNIGNGFVSPVFNEENFYITGEVDSMEILFSFNLKGEKQWQTTLGKEWMKSYPGSRSAPTIVDDLIYVGTGLGNLFCINRINGNIVWSNKGFGERSAYNSPRLIELPSRKIIVTFSAYHLMGFDSETGKLLWSTEIWRNRGFDSFMGGFVKIGDYLYGCGTVKPELRAINASTGELTNSLRVGSGAIIAADNMLYYYTQKGDMMLLSFNQGKMEKVSSFRVKEGTLQSFSHPVIHKGVLYQRHGNALVAFDIHNK